MRKLLGGTLVAVALLGGAARAHEGGTHARGVVKEISAERIVLTPPKGEPLEFALGKETRILRGNERVPVDAVRTGERAIVHASRQGDRLVATDVKLGPAKK